MYNLSIDDIGYFLFMEQQENRSQNNCSSDTDEQPPITGIDEEKTFYPEI